MLALIRLQVASFVVRADFLQRLGLDLADTLARHAELLPHLLKRVVDPVGESVPHLEDLALLAREVIQDRAHMLAQDTL